jgi:hypothetical protein
MARRTPTVTCTYKLRVRLIFTFSTLHISLRFRPHPEVTLIVIFVTCFTRLYLSSFVTIQNPTISAFHGFHIDIRSKPLMAKMPVDS